MYARVALVSNDNALAALCRDILTELFGTDWLLTVGGAGEELPPHDVCIWEFAPGDTPIRGVEPENLKRQLFVVHRKHLGALRELVGTPDVTVLLKPVTRPTLRAFLGETCRGLDAAARIGTLREDRDEMLQCLMQANLKLQEYDQERTNFLARSIHDFRAPLTAISGYCELLREGQLGDVTAEQREILSRVQHSAKRLSRMANAMFQLSTAANVQQTPDLQKGDIRDPINQALHEVMPFIESKQISVTTDIQAQPEPLLFEASQMEQLVINLLDNACKFTPRAGTIQVNGYPFFWDRRAGHAVQLDSAAERRMTKAETANSFRVDIRDSGPGIPAMHLDTIFEEYTSYSGGQDRSGGGLGLAICKMILQQHQGRVWAEHSPAGAVFSFVLPLRRPDDYLADSNNGSWKLTCAGARR